MLSIAALAADACTCMLAHFYTLPPAATNGVLGGKVVRTERTWLPGMHHGCHGGAAALLQVLIGLL